MKPKFLLIHITPPPSEGIEYQKQRSAFDGLIRNLSTEMQNQKGVETLGESVWLIPLEHSLPVLAVMFPACQAQQLRIRVLSLEEPEWIELNAGRS